MTDRRVIQAVAIVAGVLAAYQLIRLYYFKDFYFYHLGTLATLSASSARVYVSYWTGLSICVAILAAATSIALFLKVTWAPQACIAFGVAFVANLGFELYPMIWPWRGSATQITVILQWLLPALLPVAAYALARRNSARSDVAN